MKKPITFQIGKCPKCGRLNELMFSNNPLIAEPICFDCIAEQLDYNNLSQADFFCRTYNLPFNPDLWIKLADEYGNNTFKEYTKMVLAEGEEDGSNLYYGSTTQDLWAKLNKEWAKSRSFIEILAKIESVRDSYVDRGRLKWGQQYDFAELIKLDSIYSKTLKANNITNPMQKQAVKTLCKLQIEIDEAIQMKDAKSLKDLSTSWSAFAKQADLESMINDTKTDDILTVADLYNYMEEKGFKFTYYDGFPKDEVDRALKDITESNRRLILEAGGTLQSTLEDMTKHYQEKLENAEAKKVAEEEKLKEMLDFSPDAEEVETEEDAAALGVSFDDEIDTGMPKKVEIVRKEVN